MALLMFAIVDFARIYTTMLSVESAAREAADYATEMGAAHWQFGSEMDTTVAEMQRRACVASSNLPDYSGSTDTCTNPTFAYCLTPPGGGTCFTPVTDVAGCDDPTLVDPCTVTVTLTYTFRLLAPVNIEVLGTHIGLPSTFTFTRDSTFAMTDIDLGSP